MLNSIAFSVFYYQFPYMAAGLLASQTRLVPSAVQSYDQQLAADLWELSAEIAKVSSQPITASH